MKPNDVEALWTRHFQGDRPAYEQLVEHYLPIVKTTVGRIAMNIPAFVDREDLYSAGCMGLISAVTRYNPDREAKFTTYAITRIRGAILDELRSHDLLGRVTRERVTRIHTAERDLQNRGEELTPEQIAEEAGLTLDEYWDAEIGQQATRMVSLSEPTDEEAHTLADLIQARHADKPGHALETAEIIDLIYDLLEEKERLLVVLYYKEELTLKEIGGLLGVSESRVCQLHAAMARSIRKKLEMRGVLY